MREIIIFSKIKNIFVKDEMLVVEVNSQSVSLVFFLLFFVFFLYKIPKYQFCFSSDGEPEKIIIETWSKNKKEGRDLEKEKLEVKEEDSPVSPKVRTKSDFFLRIFVGSSGGPHAFIPGLENPS